MDPILAFVIFWGVWVLFPFIVDGAQVIVQAIGVLVTRRLLRKPKVAFHLAEQLLPTVSVIIPTYNEERNVDQCLNSLKIQSYPHEKMEVIVVDDGSTDRTSEYVSYHLGSGPDEFEIEGDPTAGFDDAESLYPVPGDSDKSLPHPVLPSWAGPKPDEASESILLQEIGGRPVITASDGKKLGMVSDVLIDLESQRVVALLVVGENEAMPWLLPYRDAWIGERSVMVKETEAPDAEASEISPEGKCLGKALSHFEIRSPSGRPVGQPAACRLSRETGDILDYLVTFPEEPDRIVGVEDFEAYGDDELYVAGRLVGEDGQTVTVAPAPRPEPHPATPVHDPGTGFSNGHSDGHGNGNGNGHGKVRIKDHSYEIKGFGGAIRLLTPGHQGKAHALNLGIENAHGDIVFTLDSDVMLAPRAIQEVVSLFLADPNLGAATGTIEVSPEIVEETDEHGSPITDEAGEFKTKKLQPMESFLSKCQFLEYLSAFHIGRQHQAATNTLYTLAGAFSAFRRDVLLRTGGYRNTTVSEDTDLTLEVHRQGVRLGYAPEAKAMVKPVLTWSDLYAQRVRWMRGQLEVCAAHRDMVGGSQGLLGRLALPRMLLMDHTLAFPRVVWTMMLPLLMFFGYSPRVVVIALLLMYLFYVGVEFLVTLTCYAVAGQETREEILDNLHLCFVMPFYRFVTFYFRLSGYLRALNDPPEWRVEGPLTGLRVGFKDVAIKGATLAAPLIQFLGAPALFKLGSHWLGASISVAIILHQKLQALGLGRAAQLLQRLATGSFWSITIALTVLGLILYLFSTSGLASP